MTEKKSIDWTRIGIFIVLALLVTVLIFNIKQCSDTGNINNKVVEMKQLQDGIVRSQSKYASKKDIEDLSKKVDINLDVVRKDLDKFDAEIKGISTILVKSLAQNRTDVPSTHTYPRPNNPNGSNPVNPYTCPDNKPCKDPYGYLTNAQVLSVSELFSDKTKVPIGNVTFESWKEKPWTILQYSRLYHMTTILGQDEYGKHYTYHKFQIEVNGKKHTVPIASSKLLEKQPEPKFHIWNPRVGVGLYGGVGFNTAPLPDESIVTGVVAPNISFSPFSYGAMKVKPDWVFGRIGVGYDFAQRSANFSLSPVMWNIGSKVDFIQNTYIGPIVGVDTDGNVSIGAGISTDF